MRSDRPLPELDLGSVGSRLRRWPAVESLREGDAMDVQFITSVAVITPNPAVSRRLYLDAVGLPLTAEADGYRAAKTSTAARASASGPWLKLPKPASEPLTGQLIDRCRRRASSSRSPMLTPSKSLRTS